MPSSERPDAERAFVAIVLDRSGSMSPLRDDAIGGFNTLLEEQKAQAGETRLLLAQFDSHYEIVFDAVPIAQVPPLTRATFVPRAGTALLDALGRTMNDVAARLERLPADDRPGRVLIAVITDGEENSSREYDAATVRAMIEGHRDREGWEFEFLGTSPVALAESQGWGIDGSSTMMFSATGVGLRAAFRAVGDSICGRRKGAPVTPGDSPKKKMN